MDTNLEDALAEDTAFDLLEMRQANQAKKTITFAGGHTYEVPETNYQAKESNNEIND